jgi:gamma-glutamylcyclotransferase
MCNQCQFNTQWLRRKLRPVLYFAYGSNMNWQQMKKRCLSARFVSIALLPEYKLAFTRESINRGCGVADVVREPGQKVWGVVYQLSHFDMEKLDLSEGYKIGRQKNSYWRRECQVLQNQRPLTVFTYFGEPQLVPPGPNAEYKTLIVSGARYWNLPDDYIRDLETIEVVH